VSIISTDIRNLANISSMSVLVESLRRRGCVSDWRNGEVSIIGMPCGNVDRDIDAYTIISE
jgi:hypothetical protein